MLGQLLIHTILSQADFETHFGYREVCLMVLCSTVAILILRTASWLVNKYIPVKVREAVQDYSFPAFVFFGVAAFAWVVPQFEKMFVEVHDSERNFSTWTEIVFSLSHYWYALFLIPILITCATFNLRKTRSRESMYNLTLTGMFLFGMVLPFFIAIGLFMPFVVTYSNISGQ